MTRATRKLCRRLARKFLTRFRSASRRRFMFRLEMASDSPGDFGLRHRVQRVVAIAPFTTLREEAARIISRPLSHLLIENYDNRAGIAQIHKRNPEAKIAIFHGTNDEVIPVRMGSELAQEFPFVE